MWDSETQTMIDKILSQCTDPDAYDLIEKLIQKAQSDRTESIKLDLADFDQTEAVEIIKINYWRGTH